MAFRMSRAVYHARAHDAGCARYPLLYTSPVPRTPIALSVGADGFLPREFCVYRAGRNTSTQGDLFFDDVAAASTMTAYARHGVEIAIDLQHDSIDPNVIAHRSDAQDARGWCSLAVRRDAAGGPELWAVDVTWTPDGAERLTSRKQRFISPVVLYSRETRRVLEIYNFALVAQPATDHAPPLVASAQLTAARRAYAQRAPMDPTLFQAALDALIAGDAAKCAEILKQLIAAAAGAEPAEPDEGAPGDATAEPADPAVPAARALAAALRAALHVEGDDTKVLAEVKRMRAQVDALTLSRDADERNERVALCGELVKLGAELPATAWANPEKQVPSEALSAMSMPVLRARVASFRARGPLASGRVAPPQGEPTGEAALSDSDRARAATIKDPAARDRFVAVRLARKGL